jgi:hypothetical protein
MVSPHNLWICLSVDVLKKDAAVKHDMDRKTGHEAGHKLLYSPDSLRRQHQDTGTAAILRAWQHT